MSEEIQSELIGTQGSTFACTRTALYWSHKRTLENAIESIAGNLPEGWIVQLGIERGSAFVHIENPEGEGISIDEGDGDLYDHLRAALQFAIKNESNTKLTDPKGSV